MKSLPPTRRAAAFGAIVATVVSAAGAQAAATEPPAARTIAALRAGTQQAGADAGAWVALGDALMQTSRDAPDDRLYDEAAAAYERALALEPDHVGAMVGLAWVRNTEHDFDAGRAWAAKALAAEPRQAEAHALLGDAAVELGAYDEAFGHYQQALDIRPDLSSLSRAAHLLWLTGDAARAKQLMRKAIAAGGPYVENTAWCRAELALMSLETGALVIAEREAALALEAAPDNPHVLRVTGRIKTAREDYAAAIEYYERSVAIAPHHDALVALGDLYAATGRAERAERLYARVVAFHRAQDPHDHGGAKHSHRHGRGSAQLARFYADHDRDLGEALNQAEAAYRVYKNIFTMDTLAWCYYKNGRLKDARKLIDEVLKYETPDAAILYHAGMIYAKLGRRPAAQRYLYRALSLNPRFHPVQAREAADALRAVAGAG